MEKSKMTTAVYPGSFDPITNGHLDIIKRAAKIFDKVTVAVLLNTSKQPLFSLEERVELLKETVKDIENVDVRCFSGLLIDFVEENNIDVIVKGLRAMSDFEVEFQMAAMNRKISNDIETMFLMTGSEYFYLSSSMVKEVFRFGGSISELVPVCVEKRMIEKKSGGGF